MMVNLSDQIAYIEIFVSRYTLIHESIILFCVFLELVVTKCFYLENDT